MTDTFVTTVEGAASGGAKGVKKVRGILTEIKPPEDSKFTQSAEDLKKYGEPKQQITLLLEEAAILEMFEGEEEYELKDGKFTIWESYAVKGKTPHQNSVYIKCLVASAKECGYDDLKKAVGQMVTLEKQPRMLFKQPVLGEDSKPILDDNDEKTYNEIRAVDSNGRPNHFCFVADEGISAGDIVDRIKEKITGKNLTAAMRALVMDTRIGQFPEYKTQLENDPQGLAKELGLKLVGEGDDAKFED